MVDWLYLLPTKLWRNCKMQTIDPLLLHARMSALQQVYGHYI
ncbi:MAG: hypothetical protein U9O90_08560 [Euryarchaeota archaeon]|nr:hypothetical protein [Euryarchaeota archaeon]